MFCQTFTFFIQGFILTLKIPYGIINIHKELNDFDARKFIWPCMD